MTKLLRLGERLLWLSVLTLASCGKPNSAPEHSPADQVGKAAHDRPLVETPGQQPPTMDAAVGHFERGDLASAERMTRSILVATPQDLTANALLVSILVERGDAEQAIQILDELSAAHPRERDQIAAQAADIALKFGDIEQAMMRFERIVNASPGFSIARRRLAQILNQQGYRFDANEHLRQLAGQLPFELSELRGFSYPMLPFVNVTEKPDIENLSQIKRLGVLTAARAFLSQGDVDECLELLAKPESEPLERSQRRSAIEAFRLWTLATAQQHEVLRPAIGSAASECQRYPEFWLAAGSLALHDHHAAAVTCFAEAIRREPNCIQAHEGLLVALEQSDETELAVTVQNRVRQIKRIQVLTSQIVSSPQLNQADFVEIVELSKDMGHTMESLLWQQFMFGAIAPTAPQMQVLQQYLQRTHAAYPRGFDESLVLCGIDLSATQSTTQWFAELKSIQPASSTSLSAQSQRNQVESVPAVFNNIATAVGIDFQYENAAVPVEREFRIFQAYGSGVVCVDFDHDGLVDLYFGQAATDPPDGVAKKSNAFYRNLGRRFVDVAAVAGADDRRYTTGVTSGDWNQDGFPDLAIGNLAGNRLLTNQGDGTFKIQHVHADWQRTEYTTSLAIADITGDALPDLVAINYLDDDAIFQPIRYSSDGKPVSLPGPLHFKPGLDRVFVSLGDAEFQSRHFGPDSGDGTSATNFASTGLGVLVTDIDADGVNDVFVANDLRANQLWVRDTDMSKANWLDVAVARGVAYGDSGRPMACMGIAAADIDSNGRLDLYITNFEDQWSNQYMQNQSGAFVDQIIPLGLGPDSRDLVGFGTQAIDYDNNSTWDLVVGNGHVEDFTAKGKLFAMPTQLFAFDGIRYQSVAVAGDAPYWNQPHWSRGLAKCDWNRDGHIDFVVTDLKQPAALVQNQTTTPNDWLQIELVGSLNERDAIGATVHVEVGGRRWTQSVQTGDGYLAKNEAMLHFGLGPVSQARDGSGEVDEVDRITVVWPKLFTGEAHSVTTQSVENVRLNSRVLVIQNEADAWYR